MTQYLTTTNYNSSASKTNSYIVIHYTANNGDTAMNNAKYFYDTYRGASAHYFVDENETVQVVLDKDIAWHCGATTYVHSYCRNANSIGIEMCSRIDSFGNYYIKDEVVENTISLVKELMKTHNIPLTNVLRHYDVTGKICPAPFVNDNSLWEDFKNMAETEITVTTAKAIIQEKTGFTDETMTFLYNYRYGDSLLVRLAKAMQ